MCGAGTKNAPVPCIGTRALNTSWCHPNSALRPFDAPVTGSAPGRFPSPLVCCLGPFCRGALSAGGAPLCWRRCAGYSCKFNAGTLYNRRFSAGCQGGLFAVKGLLLGLTMSRQSVQHFSKPKRSFAAAAISGTMSQIVFKTGTAGAGQNYLGMSEYTIECAFPMIPAPTRPTFSFFIVNSSLSFVFVMLLYFIF